MIQMAIINRLRTFALIGLSMVMGLGMFPVEYHPEDVDQPGAISLEASLNISVADQQVADADDHEQINQEPEEKGQPDQDAHSCGTCHVHIVGLKMAHIDYLGLASLPLRPLSDQPMIMRDLHGLYRPPRA